MKPEADGKFRIRIKDPYGIIITDFKALNYKDLKKKVCSIGEKFK